MKTCRCGRGACAKAACHRGRSGITQGSRIAISSGKRGRAHPFGTGLYCCATKPLRVSAHSG